MPARIISDPTILSGKPVVAGTRIPVSLILNLLAHGYDIECVLTTYPLLTAEDVQAALLYSAKFLPGGASDPVAQPA